jgi:hypothetical protein
LFVFQEKNCCGSAVAGLSAFSFRGFCRRGGIAAHRDLKSFKGFVFQKRGVRVGFRFGYLRFRYRCIPSMVSACWNPCSISCVASCGVVAVLHMYSSSPFSTIALR